MPPIEAAPRQHLSRARFGTTSGSRLVRFWFANWSDVVRFSVNSDREEFIEEGKQTRKRGGQDRRAGADLTNVRVAPVCRSCRRFLKSSSSRHARPEGRADRALARGPRERVESGARLRRERSGARRHERVTPPLGRGPVDRAGQALHPGFCGRGAAVRRGSDARRALARGLSGGACRRRISRRRDRDASGADGVAGGHQCRAVHAQPQRPAPGDAAQPRIGPGGARLQRDAQYDRRRCPAPTARDSRQ
jgi:hypothetical protein